MLAVRLWVVGSLLLGVLLTGCPDPAEVGHAPKATIDQAHRKLDKAERLMNKQETKTGNVGE